MYDMQSQMFDQQIHMVRWTGNASHMALLRPALTLHATWAEDCFDKDVDGSVDGLYRSYINTWPTDSVWYNGADSVEETAYMFRAYTALRDLAERSNDTAAAATYRQRLDAIQSNFSQLWLPHLGHPASWREEVGLRRLRPDPWLYAVFLPIEAGLWTPEQAAQALHYAEYGVQHDPVSCDGTACGHRVWTSKWVPGIWSVRQLWPGDEMALAMAYLTTGLADDGFDVFLGSATAIMRQSGVPGAIGAPNGGIDFK